MNIKRAIELLERMLEPEAWEPKITADAEEALCMAIDALRREEKDDAGKDILRENIRVLEIKIAQQAASIEALKFSIRCNGVSGDSVKDGPL